MWLSWASGAMQTGASWAYDSLGNIVFARESTKQGGPFRCRCGQNHLLHLSKPSGRRDKRRFEPYFAHNGRRCLRSGGGGESELHLEAKALLQTRHGRYYFHTQKCSTCDWRREERLVGGAVHMEHRDGVLGYRYDCYWSNGARQMALEVLHTHACTMEKLQQVRQSGLLLAEFHAKQIKAKLLRLPADGSHVLLENLQEKTVSCVSCTRRMVHCELFSVWCEEVCEIGRQEQLVEAELQQRFRREAELLRRLQREAEQRQGEAERSEREAEREKREAEQRKRENKEAETWVRTTQILWELHSAFLSEVSAVATLEKVISHGYWGETDPQFFLIDFGRHQGLTFQSLHSRFGAEGIQYILCLSHASCGKASEAAIAYLQGKCQSCGKATRGFRSVADYFRKGPGGIFCSAACCRQTPVQCDLSSCALCKHSRGRQNTI